MVKPSKKKKKFIGKHEEKVSFCLVHRSQKDPLTADEKAPQHVLLQLENKNDLEKRKAEQKKYGIFFDDDYNYLQHLRDVNRVCDLEPIDESLINSNSEVRSRRENESKLNLPSSVFASEVEEETGLLNKAVPLRGPQVNWDPDIVAALDDDFNFEDPSNRLEDDFIALANASDQDSKDGSDLSENKENFSEDDNDENFSRSRRRNCEPFYDIYDNEETQSRFTDYSLSSAVIPRNSGLKTLDNRFEKLYEQYDDCEIGSLDGDDIAGYMSTDSMAFQQVLDSYHKQLEKSDHKQVTTEDKNANTLQKSLVEDNDAADDYTTLVLEEPTEKWDCESILSTYSNIYNHPKLITEPSKLTPIHVSKTMGIPLESLKNRSLKTTLKRLDCDSESVVSSNVKSKSSASNLSRNKSETPDEKRLRKSAVKELRRERRMEKKANSLAFKEEKKRQEKVLLNVQKSLQGIKLV